MRWRRERELDPSSLQPMTASEAKLIRLFHSQLGMGR